MAKPSGSSMHKKAVARLASGFLERNFGLRPQSIKVLMDPQTVVIRAENSLSAAELQLAGSERDTHLVQEMYARLFERTKSSLIDEFSRLTSKEILSTQINLDFQARALLITLLLKPPDAALHKRRSAKFHLPEEKP